MKKKEKAHHIHVCFKGHSEVGGVRLLLKGIVSFALWSRDGQHKRHEVCCWKVPDGNECKRLKQNMTEKELKHSVGLPLACKI